MRLLGTLDQQQDALRLAYHLQQQEIESRVLSEGDGWAVWVIDEDQMETASNELAQFLADPTNARYATPPSSKSFESPSGPEPSRRARRPRTHAPVSYVHPTLASCPVTLAMIGISLAVGLASNFGETSSPVVKYLSISPYRTVTTDGVDYLQWYRGLKEVRQGQVWRLFTPMFIHFGLMHLMMDMGALYYMGSVFEYLRGSRRYALFVALAAVISNVPQFYVSGPSFGGMSGVVFALFGYIWMKSQFDSESGFHLPTESVVFILAFFAICFTGLVGPIANAAHTGGLVFGALVGLASSFLKRWIPVR
jgi:GlpG protein